MRLFVHLTILCSFLYWLTVHSNNCRYWPMALHMKHCVIHKHQILSTAKAKTFTTASRQAEKHLIFPVHQNLLKTTSHTAWCVTTTTLQTHILWWPLIKITKDTPLYCMHSKYWLPSLRLHHKLSLHHCFNQKASSDQPELALYQPVLFVPLPLPMLPYISLYASLTVYHTSPQLQSVQHLHHLVVILNTQQSRNISLLLSYWDVTHRNIQQPLLIRQSHNNTEIVHFASLSVPCLFVSVNHWQPQALFLYLQLRPTHRHRLVCNP